MSKSLESVKAVEAFLRSAIDRNPSPETKATLEKHADVIEEFSAELMRLRKLTSSLPPDLGDIHDLPQALLDELSVSKTDELEDQIVTAINAYEGEASLDQILVGLYRKFKVSQKRRFVQNKLYKMIKSEVIWAVEGKKGVYSTSEPQQTIGYGGYSGYTPPADNDVEDEIPF